MIIKHFPFALLSGFALILSVLAADDQTGFISLDCGLPASLTYSEPDLGIQYISDEPFIDTGVSKSIAPEYIATHQQQAAHVRSFPQWTRNCYRVNITSGTKYLIRASFVYGNYDGLNELPKFDLHLGPSFWDSITLADAAASTIKEVIHTPSVDYIHVCLVNTGSGIPFISALELRPLKNNTYTTKSGSLALEYRLDVGSKTNRSYRYNYDVFDRLWLPFDFSLWGELSTTVDSIVQNSYQMPSIVMSTAGTPLNASNPMYIGWNTPDTSSEYYVYMHFTEIQKLKANETRSFNITLNDKPFYGPLVPDNLSTITVYSPAALTGGNFTFSLFKTESSTLPPILNAMEYYRVIDFSQSETNGDDVVAITNIKSAYGIEKNWQGDPCAPKDYIWEGLNCSSDDPPRITSLDLSSSGLTGEIPSYISNLDMLQSLDISNNSFTGSVPEFLTKLPKLKFLNLEKNKLNGSLPSMLIEKSTSGSLSLRVGENENLCAAISCKKKKKNVLIPIIAAVGGFAILFVASIAIFLSMKRKRKQVGTAVTESNIQIDSFENFESKKRQFTYSEVLKITNNFQKVLGKGGFGMVYHGYVDDTQVAVKVLSPSSVQGYQQFQAEVKLLMRVHHRNLTGLVGYCNEGPNMALLYEYMANGDLESHILGEDSNAILSWESRLRIAADAAQGLEYLHNGCKPPIIHRDVKTTNILLAENFQAKLADFGLSRMFPTDEGTHMSTAVAGTPGYLDPEYHITGWLNEKSDVYSFGVALLQIITSRPVISRTSQVNSHVSQWVSSMLSTGDIKSIVDPKLRGDFEINSAWKAVELARDCMSDMSTARPNMSEVVTRLKECFGAELARLNESRASGTTDSSIVFSMNSGFSPSAR
ncbi:PREDICTED: receptor-like protein kinase At3g21340 [Fragaria vesca subsp. vesca]|uniref:receptor-like protein kinase At3g21340 n=1 Tax=Fragaria vesca subsp. vesca TaxID=101020 RepID=UPI0002C3366B|nr:PREDICTED: receptor-like protein kinase At3g21340 [Fragaria vesca subsp. vesca]